MSETEGSQSQGDRTVKGLVRHVRSNSFTFNSFEDGGRGLWDEKWQHLKSGKGGGGGEGILSQESSEKPNPPDTLVLA